MASGCVNKTTCLQEKEIRALLWGECMFHSMFTEVKRCTEDPANTMRPISQQSALLGELPNVPQPSADRTLICSQVWCKLRVN